MTRAEAVSGRRSAAAFALGALGVVYGDIGTSPLYAFRESVAARSDVAVDAVTILGVLSLITWSLLIVISVKYVVFVLRADHNGEGGILALTALISGAGDQHGRGVRRALILIGVFGTALLYGDGMITPAISVLSAVEGLRLVTATFDPFIIPVAVVILGALFAFQRRGTGAIGAVFGPIMIVWFTVLAGLGVVAIAGAPEVLAAVNPWHGVRFLAANGFAGLLALGSVFLVVTGGEALYADMGQLGRRPIRQAWFVVVLPALLCNYYGQGALLLGDPTAIDNPFYRLAPGWAVVPLVVLSTMATVIASQALISGVFSLTTQAVQMGYVPRLRVRHTSASQIGQVYVPAVNWWLMVACVGLVVAFKSSANLAAAYGVAVTTTMVVTTLLFAVVARERFGWPLPGVLALSSVFLVVDLGFFGANLFKIPDGGWFPLLIGMAVYTAMTTWRRGRLVVVERIQEGAVGVGAFVRTLGDESRVPGTAVYLTAVAGKVPAALLANLRHNNALHASVLLVHVDVTDAPHVQPGGGTTIVRHPKGFTEITLRYGFRDRTDVPNALHDRAFGHLVRGVDADDVTYVVGREHVITGAIDMPGWRARLFAALSRNAADVAASMHLPDDRVIEIGVPVTL